MHAFTRFLPAARDIIRPLWSLTGERMASQATKWLYSEEGAWAYTRFAERMLDSLVMAQMDVPLGQRLHLLAQEIFALEVEIAARREGWCPELESPPYDAEEREYRRVEQQETC